MDKDILEQIREWGRPAPKYQYVPIHKMKPPDHLEHTTYVKRVTPDNPAIPVVRRRYWGQDDEDDDRWAFTGGTGGMTRI